MGIVVLMGDYRPVCISGQSPIVQHDSQWEKPIIWNVGKTADHRVKQLNMGFGVPFMLHCLSVWRHSVHFEGLSMLRVLKCCSNSSFYPVLTSFLKCMVYSVEQCLLLLAACQVLEIVWHFQCLFKIRSCGRIKFKRLLLQYSYVLVTQGACISFLGSHPS